MEGRLASWRQAGTRLFKTQLPRLAATAVAQACRNDLPKLATIFGCDKWNRHWYAQHYDRHFRRLRLQPLKILEVGIGGYVDPNDGGRSLRMWKAYFPHSRIYGVDIYDKRGHEEPRIKTFQGRQEDEAFMKRVVEEMGGVDIAIDDGSHVNAHAIAAFQILFPLLSDRGIYVVEDTQTSYWPGFGGRSDDLNDPATIMGYFKGLLDRLNHAELLRPGYEPSYFDRHIVAMHFYHNLIFIEKGDNTEGSDTLTNNATSSDWVLVKNFKVRAPDRPA